MIKIDSKAWNEGFHAGENWKPRIEAKPKNPYPHTSVEAYSWISGYIEGSAKRTPLMNAINADIEDDVAYFRDGDEWCAVRPDFINIQESPCGFGPDRELARLELESRPTREMSGKGEE